MKPFWIAALLLVTLGASAAERTVDVGDGVKIRCLDSGQAGAKTPVLLVTGWRIAAEVWAPQIARFEKERRVVAIDPRSQGLSTITPNGNTPEQRARDIDAVARALQLDHFLLVGWSQASQDVAAYVEQFGVAHLKAIVLVDSPVSAGPIEVDEHKGFVRQILMLTGIYVEHPREYTAGLLQSIFKKGLTPAESSLLTERAMRTPVDTGVAMLMADMFQRDRRPSLAKFTVPTLVIASPDSPLLDVQKEMATKLPHGEFVAVDGAGHAVFHDQPEKFNELLAGLLAKVD